MCDLIFILLEFITLSGISVTCLSFRVLGFDYVIGFAS